MAKDSKIIIVGSGVFGLSAAYHLSLEGYTNISIFDRINHEKTKYSPLNGSDSASGDINKFYRIYHSTNALYSKLGIEALDVWEKWNKDIQDLPQEYKDRFLDDDLELIRSTGGLRINDSAELNEVEKHNLDVFEEIGLRSTQFDVQNPKDIQRAKLLGFNKPLEVIEDLKARGKVKNVSGSLDGIGRMLKADKGCYYVKILLERKGVKFFYEDQGELAKILYKDSSESEVTGIETKDGKQHLADYVLVSTGPWSTSLVHDLQHRLQASLANVVYLPIPKDRKDLFKKYSKYPHIQWKTTSSEYDKNDNKYSGEGGFAFFPPTENEGILKVNTRQAKLLNPKKFGDKYISVPKTLGDEALPKSVVQEAKEIFSVIAPDVVTLPGVKLITKTLWYSDAINSDFIIDFVPGKKNLLVSTGGSSHGFKYLPVSGRFFVDRIEGRTNSYTELFRWKSPDDIIEDNYGLKEEDISKEERKLFNLAEFAKEEDLLFSEADLARLDDIVLE